VDVIKAAALDPYTFVRDGYLQKRENDVYDGNPPSNFDYFESEAP
jgi:phospholipid-binding lipoprotein MlaA